MWPRPCRCWPGALLVGDSVRGSLRDLLLGRLGRTDQVVASTSLFREQLAQDLDDAAGVQRRLLGRDAARHRAGNGHGAERGSSHGAGARLRRRRPVLAIPWRERRQRSREPRGVRQSGACAATWCERGRRDSRPRAATDRRSARVAPRAARQPGAVASADRRECGAGRVARRVLARGATGRSGRRVRAADAGCSRTSRSRAA